MAGTSKCDVCEKAEAHYCCPRCSIRSCSLECCRQHKRVHGCNGKRDRTKFVSLPNYTDRHLRSDYHFLEDVLRCHQRSQSVANQSLGTCNKKRKGLDPKLPFLALCQEQPTKTKRNDEDDLPHYGPTGKFDEDCESNIPEWKKQMSFQKEGVSENRGLDGGHSGAWGRFLLEARARGIHCLTMPDGMQRHKQNRSTYKLKSNTMIWTVEWVVHSHDLKDTTKKTTHDRCIDTSIIKEAVSKHISSLSSNYHFFHRKIPCQANRPLFVRMNETCTLAEGLKGLTVVEYPTIEVVPASKVHLFPCTMTQVGGNDQNSHLAYGDT